MNIETKLRPVAAGYDEDTFAWANAQAALLRARRFDSVDLENIAEEIESLGKSVKSALGSQIERIVEHLLKLEFSSATDPERGWRESILDARSNVEQIIEDNPSLYGMVDDLIAAETTRAARKVRRILTDYDEINRDDGRRIADHRYDRDQILGEWLPPRRDPA